MSKKYNLINEQFGSLLVIEKIENKNNNNQTYWKCKCKCGNETKVITSNLISGHITQCPQCSYNSGGLKNRKDYTGTRIGKLTIVEMIYPNRTICPNGRTKARCLCDCGNEIVRTISNLMRSKNDNCIASCGCNRKHTNAQNYIKMIGEKYGRLTVLEEIWNVESSNKSNKPLVKCLCDCGREILLNRRDVLCGHTQSCGCLQKERVSLIRKVDDTGFISDSGVKILKPTIKNNKNQQLWLCQCFCGNTFEELPAKVKNNHVQSCGCGRKSIKEKIISDFLIENQIEFISEYTYQDCRYKYVLRFDFAILNEDKTVKCLIEYDGQQHYQPISLFGGEEGYKQTVYRDKLKDKYCKDHNLLLLRLPYYLSNDEIKQKILNTIKP